MDPGFFCRSRQLLNKCCCILGASDLPFNISCRRLIEYSRGYTQKTACQRKILLVNVLIQRCGAAIFWAYSGLRNCLQVELGSGRLSTNMFRFVIGSVVDPDPNCIRLHTGKNWKIFS